MEGESFCVIQMGEEDVDKEDLTPEETDEDVILVDDVTEEVRNDGVVFFFFHILDWALSGR